MLKGLHHFFRQMHFSLNASKEFYCDINEILEAFYEQYKQYSSQFLSYQLIYIRHQKNSLARLFKIFKKDSSGIINTDLIEVMDKNAKLWARLDVILDNIASHIIRNSV